MLESFQTASNLSLFWKQKGVTCEGVVCNGVMGLDYEEEYAVKSQFHVSFSDLRPTESKPALFSGPRANTFVQGVLLKSANVATSLSDGLHAQLKIPPVLSKMLSMLEQKQLQTTLGERSQFE